MRVLRAWLNTRDNFQIILFIKTLYFIKIFLFSLLSFSLTLSLSIYLFLSFSHNSTRFIISSFLFVDWQAS